MLRHAGFAVLAALASAAAAQSYPSKPVRLIVQYGPGSTIDIMARVMRNEDIGSAISERNRVRVW